MEPRGPSLPARLAPRLFTAYWYVSCRRRVTLRNIYTIQRGYEDLAERLNSLGARDSYARNLIYFRLAERCATAQRHVLGVNSCAHSLVIGFESEYQPKYPHGGILVGAPDWIRNQ